MAERWRCASCRFKYVGQQKDGRYSARVVNEKGKVVYLGRYKSAEDAAKAADVARVFLVRHTICLHASTTAFIVSLATQSLIG